MFVEDMVAKFQSKKCRDSVPRLHDKPNKPNNPIKMSFLWDCETESWAVDS